MTERSKSTLTPGMILSERYEILRPLRLESHGEVVLARDQVLGIDVGLKYLPNDHPDFGRLLEYYRREALWGLKIHHPQVLGVHHLDESAEGVFLVQEPFAGNSLGELLGHTEPLTIQDALYFIEVLAQGLAYGHKLGIVHQNFNPQQVLVSATEGIKIINFAFPPDPDHLQADQDLQAFIPPEIWQGRQVAPASNLFSLGVMGYQMLTGVLPFSRQGEGAVPYQITAAPNHFEAIPEALRPLFSRCLKAEPEKRLKSAQDFLARLAVLREKLAPSGGVGHSHEEDKFELPPLLNDKSGTPLKIMPMEPEVEINPDWPESEHRPQASPWAAAPVWFSRQRQRLTEYFGGEPLRRNRRKQIGAVIGGAVGLLVVLAGLSSLFAPTSKPPAVVRTADQKFFATAAPETPSSALGKPPVMTAMADRPGTTGGVPPTTEKTEPKAAEEAPSGPTPPLPEPAAAVKPPPPVAPAIKPQKPAVKATVKPEKVTPKPAPVRATAKAPTADSGPKLVATFEKELPARQKADALGKQGQRAVVKKATKGTKIVYQVWLTKPAATPAAKSKTNAKAVAPR